MIARGSLQLYVSMYVQSTYICMHVHYYSITISIIIILVHHSYIIDDWVKWFSIHNNEKCKHTIQYVIIYHINTMLCLLFILAGSYTVACDLKNINNTCEIIESLPDSRYATWNLHVCTHLANCSNNWSAKKYRMVQIVIRNIMMKLGCNLLICYLSKFPNLISYFYQSLITKICTI